MVRGVHHQRVVGQAGLVEVGEQAAEVVVHRGDAAQVALHERLIVPAQQLVAAQVGRRRLGHVPAQVRGGHLLRAARGRGGAVAVVVAQGGRLRQVAAGEQLGVGGVVGERVVRRLVAEVEEEGAVGVAVAQPVERHVGQDVGHVAAPGHGAARLVELRVYVLALHRQHAPVVEADRIAVAAVAQVPLAEGGGLVAGVVQHHPQRALAGVVDHVVQGADAGGVAVLAGEHRGPRRRADGVGAEAAVEARPFAGQPVQVGRGHQAGAVAGDRRRRMIICNDEQNVGPRHAGIIDHWPGPWPETGALEPWSPGGRMKCE